MKSLKAFFILAAVCFVHHYLQADQDPYIDGARTSLVNPPYTKADSKDEASKLNVDLDLSGVPATEG